MENRSRLILDRAKADPRFRERLIHLGSLRDQFTYPGMESWMNLAPMLLQFAGDAGLMDHVGSQGSADEICEWLLENVDELAFYAKGVRKFAPGPRYRESVGNVFLSWTVKNPRGREAVVGIKNALEYFNVQYFDYTEHQLDNSRDASQQIEEQLGQTIKDASITIESMSGTIGSHWLEWERDQIGKSDVPLRIFACLDTEIASHMTLGRSQEGRVIRIDMSGRHSGAITANDEDGRIAAEANTNYYRSEDFFLQCFALIWNVRRRLEGDAGPGVLGRMRDAIVFRRPREAFAFVRRAMKPE